MSDSEKILPFITENVNQRLLKHVTKDSDTGCWQWSGASIRGYGHIFIRRGLSMLAHRLSWIIANGPIPDGLNVLHRCDNPACVNPAHCFLGTHADNIADKCAKGRHSHGPKHAMVTGGLNRKMDSKQVSDMRIRYANGQPKKSLARMFGIDPKAVFNIVKRLSYKEIP